MVFKQESIKKRWYLFTLAILMFLINANSRFIPISNTSQIEIFPLAPGIAYKYHYYNESVFYDVGNWETYVDSGTVKYFILDSVTNDSIRNWQVRQNSLILHHEWNNSGHDSLFWLMDSTIFSLQENLNGMHEIKCSSVVWDFPLSYPFQSVSRFAESTNVFIAKEYIPPGYNYGVDSLWFSSDSGFSRRYRFSYTEGSITYKAGILDIHLLVGPVVSLDKIPHIPNGASLLQNYPNPFNATTILEFTLSHSEFVTLKIYNIVGEEVTTLVSEKMHRGSYRYEWDATSFSSGVYVYVMRTGNYIESKKMVLIR